MKCPSCSCENLPVRETSAAFGASVRHPRHCGECGAVLTEKCPVCWYQHPIGTKFCQADGTDIAKWRQEKALWKQIAKAAHVSITVRPWQWKAILVMAALVGVLVSVALHGPIAANVDSSDPGTAWVLASFFGCVAALFSAVIPVAIVDDRVNSRRRALFREQGYQTIPEHPDILFLSNES